MIQSTFPGTVDLTNGEIDLNGLAKANSYTYQNDMLSIFSGKSVIDTLRLASSETFSVEKTSTGGVSIYTAAASPPPGTLLPIHMS